MFRQLSIPGVRYGVSQDPQGGGARTLPKFQIETGPASEAFERMASKVFGPGSATDAEDNHDPLSIDDSGSSEVVRETGRDFHRAFEAGMKAVSRSSGTS